MVLGPVPRDERGSSGKIQLISGQCCSIRAREPLIFSNFSVIRIFRQKLDRKRHKLDINYTFIRVIRWKKIRVITVIRTTLVMSN